MSWKSTFECPFITRTSTTLDVIPSLNDHSSDFKPNGEGRNWILWILKTFIIITCVIIITDIIFSVIDMWVVDTLICKHSNSDLKNEHFIEMSETEIDIWKEKLKTFVVTKTTELIINNLNGKQALIITGPLGSGKSANAFHAALNLQKLNGYILIPVQTVGDIDRHLKRNIKQLFIIDDVIEKLPFRETMEQVCNKLKHILMNCDNVKIIMTSRSPIYILNGFQCRDIPLVHCDLLSSELQLSLKERKAIFTKYLDSNLLSEIDDTTLMQYNFFPSLCSMAAHIPSDQIVDFFLQPFDFLFNEFNNLRDKSDMAFLSLALLVVLNNKVEKDIFNADKYQSDKFIRDIFTESRFKQYPSKSLLFDTFRSLAGTFVLENETRFVCIHSIIFSIISTYMGKIFISSILTHGDTKFIMERFKFIPFDENRERFSIPLIPEYETIYFKRIMSYLNEGHIWNVFRGIETKSPVYRKKIIIHMQKHVKAKCIRDFEDRSTVLHVVSALGNADLFGYFMQKDLPDVHAIDNKLRSALHKASDSGHGHFVDILLKHKAGVNLKDEDGRTALHLACNSGHQHIVSALVTAAAKINEKDNLGLTPLYLACMKGHSITVKTLMHMKANVDLFDINNMTPLHVACRESKEDVVKLLLKNKLSIVNKVNKEGYLPLHIACENGNETICGMLCEKGAKLNQRTNVNGTTPLGIACQKGHFKVAAVLITWGSDVNLLSNGSTPLYESCKKGHIKIVELLLENKASVNGDENEQTSPLGISCDRGHLEIVRLLIERGANINERSKDGKRPISFASISGHDKVVEVLLLHKALPMSEANKEHMYDLNDAWTII